MKSVLAAGFALLAALPAHALVGGAIDPNVAASPWAGVGALSVNGGTFSGVLIGNRHVLTAAHVVGGAAPGNVSFVLNSEAGSQTYAAESISVFPGFTGTRPGPDGVWHDDLALVRLATPIDTRVPVYGLYGGSLTSKTVTLVGYGGGGDGAKGVTYGARTTVKRVGQNRIDKLLADDDGGSAPEVFVFDFDGPDAASNVFGPPDKVNFTLGETIEAHYAGGDSGSPVFVRDQGVWKIAGIATFNGGTPMSAGSNVLFGAIGGGTVVASYIPWIETATTPVPEPHAWWMLLAGLGLIGVKYRVSGRVEL
ncbi:MAG: trypsin-like serine protease [Thiobacillus sp.]|nr:trypsin-like serine protease [Thiobacillus sp.]